jgi:hypothetical protein
MQATTVERHQKQNHERTIFHWHPSSGWARPEPSSCKPVHATACSVITVISVRSAPCRDRRKHDQSEEGSEVPKLENRRSEACCSYIVAVDGGLDSGDGSDDREEREEGEYGLHWVRKTRRIVQRDWGLSVLPRSFISAMAMVKHDTSNAAHARWVQNMAPKTRRTLVFATKPHAP